MATGASIPQTGTPITRETNSSTTGKWCTLMIHSHQHSQEDVVLNPLIFNDWINSGGNLQIMQDISNLADRLVLCIPPAQTDTMKGNSRLEISLSKTLAESFGIKPFARVFVDKVKAEDVEIDFVELAFRKQFLQRGHMWRFKKSMVNRSVYIGQNISVDGVQATIQEVGSNGVPVKSGLISERTHFIFRSRSTRIIWLVQISLEMWDYDQNGDVYFEKFLYKFTGPLLDRWKALATSHMLTVIFFARTLYPDITERTDCDGMGVSLQQRSDGVFYRDFFKVVIENASEVDKVQFLRVLKKEFWAWPASVGWNISKRCNGSKYATNSTLSTIAVPSDATGGNFLEAINTTLNILDKHYMDRDLQRTGNSIVMISAGTGFFRVQPSHAKITKQRMMDSGIGIDFVSLSQPPLHVVPLFQIDCQGVSHELKDFYEMPHWIAVSYIDCKRDLNLPTNAKSDTLSASRSHYRWTGMDDAGRPLNSRPNAYFSANANVGNGFTALGGSSAGGTFFAASTKRGEKGDGGAVGDPWADWRPTFTPLPFVSYINGHMQSYAADSFSVAGMLALALPTPLRTQLERIQLEIPSEVEAPESNDSKSPKIPNWGTLATPPEKFKSSPGRQEGALLLLRLGEKSLPTLSAVRKDSKYKTMFVDAPIRKYSTSLGLNSSASSVFSAMGGISSSAINGTVINGGMSKLSSTGSETANSFNVNIGIADKRFVDILTEADVDRDTPLPSLKGSLRLGASSGLFSTLGPPDVPQEDFCAFLASHCGATNGLGGVSRNFGGIEVTTESLEALMYAHDNAVAENEDVPTGGSQSSCGSHGLLNHLSNVSQGSHNSGPVTPRRRSSLPAHLSHPFGFSINSGNSTATANPAVPAKGRHIYGGPKAVTDRASTEREHPSTDYQSHGILSSPPAISVLNSSNSPSESPQTHDDRNMLAFLLQRERERAHNGAGTISTGNTPAFSSSAVSLSFKSATGFGFSDSRSHTPRDRLDTLISSSPGLRASLEKYYNSQDANGAAASAADRDRESVDGSGCDAWINQNSTLGLANNSASTSVNMSAEAAELRAYRARYAINPFKKEEGAFFLRMRTHNRRRWSHVFPWGHKLDTLPRDAGYAGLNWKSLCQPAILPLTTDYIPQVPDLKNAYSTSSPYQLLLDEKCTFDNPESLLAEMVCQRLSQEFQLVEAESYADATLGPVFNPLPYFDYAMKMDNSSDNSKSQADYSNRLFYILSMGHRIQFLFYDAATRNVKVTQLTSIRDGSNRTAGSTASYTYELWVPQLSKYQAVTQQFTQFPDEFLWNKVDSILLGDGELDSGYSGGDSVKAKRLRFTVLPDPCTKVSDVAEYIGKLEKLVAFFQKYCQETEQMIISMDRTYSASDDATYTSVPSASARPAARANVVRIWLKPPHTATPKWAFLKHDAATSIRRAFHLELHWLVADSWLLDDFVNVMFRRCSAWGLRIAQVPEFFCSAKLQVHPFRAQPYIPVPLWSAKLPELNSGHRESNLAALSALGYSSPVKFVEKFFFVDRPDRWIEDDSRATDWQALGLPSPEYSQDFVTRPSIGINSSSLSKAMRQDIAPFSFLSDSILRSNHKSASGNSRGIASGVSASSEHPSRAAAIVNEARKRRANLDRQYMHRMAYACVRVGAMGVVWLLNSSARLNDVGHNKDEVRSQAMATLKELQSYCNAVGFVSGMLIDIIETSMERVASRDDTNSA